MFGIGFPELLMILVIALMVIGPKKLPDIAKALGRAMGEFKRATDEFKHSINEETRAAEIREQIIKGGKIYPPEANAPRQEQGDSEPAPTGGVNPPPTTLGPVADKAEAEPAAPTETETTAAEKSDRD